MLDRDRGATVETPDLIANDLMNDFFRAVEEATEEAIYNSLFAAQTVEGRDGNRAEALPIDKVLALIKGR